MCAYRHSLVWPLETVKEYEFQSRLRSPRGYSNTEYRSRSCTVHGLARAVLILMIRNTLTSLSVAVLS